IDVHAIETAELRDGSCDQPTHRFIVRDIELHTARGATGIADRARGGFCVPQGKVADHDGRTFFCEPTSRRGADTAAAASDDEYLSVEPAHQAPPGSHRRSQRREYAGASDPDARASAWCSNPAFGLGPAALSDRRSAWAPVEWLVARTRVHGEQ